MSNIDLINGECIEIMKELIKGGLKVDAIITDPPYGTTSCSWDSIIPFEEMWYCCNNLIKDNGAIVLFGSEPFSSMLRCSNIKNFKYDWIWEKQKAANFMGAKNAPLKYHEIISVFSNGTHKYNPQRYKVLEFSEIENMNKKQLKEVFETKDYDRYGDWDGWELGIYILPFEWLDKIDLINTSDDEYVVKTNSDFLIKSLNEKIAYMEKFIEEEKRVEEENYLKRMEEKKKEQEEKEYQQYLELKEKFDKKD